MEIFIVIKPIIDMLWKYKIALLGIILISFIMIVVYFNKIRIDKINIIIMWIAFLMTLSFLKNIDVYSFNIFIKIISNLIVFIIGRTLYLKEKKISDKLVMVFYIVIIVNFIMMILGFGFIRWGGTLTFKGIYYFKTDLAVAFSQAFIFIRLAPKKYNLINNIIRFIIIPCGIFLSNSRVFFVIYIILVVIFICESMEKKKKINLKIGIGMVVNIIIVTCISMIILVNISKIGAIKNLNLISFDFNSGDEFAINANTQGRNVIWEGIISNYNKQPIINKIIGIDLISDFKFNELGVDAHNNYLKILITIGAFGLMLFAILIIYTIININNEKNIKIKYTSIALLITYLISGISISNITFTQQSWIFMLYMGIVIPYYSKTDLYILEKTNSTEYMDE